VFIKPSQKRIEFERLLHELGYKDRLPVYPKEDKRYQKVNFKCSDGAMAIYTLKERISTLAENIHFNEKTRLMEVGWEVKYTKQPDEFSLEERKQIFYHFMNYTYKNLEEGMVNLFPRPGDILAAKPHGPKINEGFTESSLMIGKYQRSLVTRKFGFGELQEDGFQYARYDKNCILKPI
jgi:hypothetical protein